MNVEHLTKEELANELLSGDWTGHAKDITDEAARRLRNSIQKPVVDEFVDKLLAQYVDPNHEMSELGPAMGRIVLQFRKDHLMEGGGDE